MMASVIPNDDGMGVLPLVNEVNMTLPQGDFIFVPYDDEALGRLICEVCE